VYLPGIDKQNRSFNIDLIIVPEKYPTAFGADQLKGVFTFYTQSNTPTYFQTGLKIFGSMTFNELTEPVIGTMSHIDRLRVSHSATSTDIANRIFRRTCDVEWHFSELNCHGFWHF
jgi:hypothetical protein